ncbi:head GIN domain-containing protein [Lacinutrix jangbogonensis]|uniref:head GIN domain-containing protein n=1 Tax=Lacinutrix jangbogonensis TaxID=1469557 RepID=UPI00053CF47D|nr:head GIN domain-containing protein [Lacinutrix jangbogonensis]
MKTSKNTLLIAIALLTFSFSQAQSWGSKKIKGNGNITTITKSTSDYDEIKCSGWMDFKLVKGKEGKIIIEGESNLLEYIIVEVDGNTLKIKTENNINLKPSYNKTIKITIPFKDIDYVSLSGSGDITNKDKIVANNFTARVSGSGDIVLDVDAKDIDASITGSGDLTLNGKTKDLKASVTGSGDFHGYGLEAIDVAAKVTGSGDVEIVCNGHLNGRVTGSGDIEYKGSPKSEDTKVTGSGSIGN